MYCALYYTLVTISSNPATIVGTLAVVDPPFNLMIANVTQNTLQYSWEVANTSCNGSNIAGYTRSLDEQSPVDTSTGDTTEDSITGLQPNTSHTVRVRVVCGDGRMSNFSTPLPFTTEKFGELCSDCMCILCVFVYVCMFVRKCILVRTCVY